MSEIPDVPVESVARGTRRLTPKENRVHDAEMIRQDFVNSRKLPLPPAKTPPAEEEPIDEN